MDTYEKAKKLAAGYVARRMYTCGEVEDRLKQKGIDAAIAEMVVSEFAAARILNDKEYAALYVSDALEVGGKGVYRIKQELYKKRVARSIVEDVCAEIEEGAAVNALRKYIDSRRLCDGITSRRELEKLKARLARRGFSLSDINDCLANYEFEIED